MRKKQHVDKESYFKT